MDNGTDFEKRLAKIEDVSFGIGGYQDACIGLNVVLAGKGWGVCSSKTAWDANIIKHSEYSKWTEEDRSRQYAEIVRYVSDLLCEAKVNTVNDLKGKPVEVTFDKSGTLQGWRILTEVL
jgi:hypothetical protein